MVLKSLFLSQNDKIPQRLEAVPPQAPSTICLSCISLFSTGPKSDKFCSKNFTFGSSPLSLSRILVALLVVISAADRIFKQLNGLDTKQVKKHCRPYTSLFLDMNTKILK